MKNDGWDIFFYAGYRYVSDKGVGVKNEMDTLQYYTLHWDKHYNHFD